MRRFAFAFALCSAMYAQAAAQEPPVPLSGKETVAVVGEAAITVDEFIKRHDFTPWPGKDRKGAAPRTKLEVLHALIAEKLLALDARSRGIQDDPSIRALVDEIERLLVLDALYRTEVVDNARVADRDVFAALPFFHTALDLEYISFEEHLQAEAVLRRARAAGRLAATARDYSRPVDQLTIRIADMKPHLADMVLDSFAVGRIYGPVEMEGAWYLFQLMDFRERISADPQETQAARWRVRNELRQRREQAAFDAFIDEFSAGKQAEVDGTLYNILIEEIERLLQETKARLAEYGQVEQYPVVLSRQSFAWIGQRLAEHTATPMLISEHFSRPLGYVIDRMSVRDFVLSDESHSVRSALNTMLRRLIEEEFLIQEGYARRLHERSDIVEEVSMWQDAYLADRVDRQIAMDVEDSETPRPVWEVNIREILVSRESLADSLLREIESGAEMAALAQAHSERPWAAEEGGEFGYFLTTEYGRLGELSAEAEIGELLGPVALEEGYSVFRLLDRRRPLYAVPEGGRNAAVDSTVNAHISRLAGEYGYTIDFEMLDRIRVAGFNQMVIRNLGFNNRMPGAPVLSRRILWPEMIEGTAPRVGL